MLCLHSSQNELPQQGIMTASVNKSLQMLQIKSSGISCFFSTGGRLMMGSVAAEFPATIYKMTSNSLENVAWKKIAPKDLYVPSINERGIPVLRLTSVCVES